LKSVAEYVLHDHKSNQEIRYEFYIYIYIYIHTQFEAIHFELKGNI